MIQQIDMSGVHLDLDEKIKKYTIAKIGKLDRFIPRHARESARAEIFIKESKVKTRKSYACEVVLKLPQETIIIEEKTMNMFASVDIVEAKLKNRLKKYKETHSSLKLHHRVLSRLRRSRPAE